MAIKTAEQIQAIVMAKAGKGLRNAAYFFRARVVEEISVPAPRRIVRTKTFYLDTSGGFSRMRRGKDVRSYVATTKATPGAPPRKVSGRLRASIAVQMITTSTGVTARIGSNVIYARRLEVDMNHAYLVPELNRQEANVRTIIAGAA